jgi:hypothetical protein
LPALLGARTIPPFEHDVGEIAQAEAQVNGPRPLAGPAQHLIGELAHRRPVAEGVQMPERVRGG